MSKSVFSVAFNPNINYVHSTFHNVQNWYTYQGKIATDFVLARQELQEYIQAADNQKRQILNFLKVDSTTALKVIKTIIDPQQLSKTMDQFKRSLKTVQKDLQRFNSTTQTKSGTQIWQKRQEGNDIIFERYRTDNRLRFIEHVDQLQQYASTLNEVREAVYMIANTNSNIEQTYKKRARQIWQFLTEPTNAAAISALNNLQGATRVGTGTAYKINTQDVAAIENVFNLLYNNRGFNLNATFGSVAESLNIEEVQPIIDQKIAEIDKQLLDTFNYDYTAVGSKNQAIDATLRFFTLEPKNTTSTRTTQSSPTRYVTVNISIKNVSTSLAPKPSSPSPSKYGYTGGISLGTFLGGNTNGSSGLVNTVTLTNIFSLGYYPEGNYSSADAQQMQTNFWQVLYAAAIQNFTEHMWNHDASKIISVVYYSGNIYWYSDFLRQYWSELLNASAYTDLSNYNYVRSNAEEIITFDSAQRYEQKKKFRVKKGDDFRTRYAAYDSEMRQNIQDMKNVTLQHALWAFSKNGNI